uniref:C2H2-type domain-containing protein n=1 Tax=Anopheles maculatus TaxID=74869 RepID=A0A182TBC5_9DIPT
SSTQKNYPSTIKVQKNQRYLAEEYLKEDAKAYIARTRVFVNDSLQYDNYCNEDGEDGSASLNADTIITQTDPLSDVSSVEYCTQQTKLEGNAVKSKTRPDGPPKSDQYSCDKCDLKLATKIQLYKHRRVHQKKECLVCNLMFRTDKLNDHFAKKHPKIHEKLLEECTEFRCVNCQELFETEAQLNDHLAIDKSKLPVGADTANEARTYYCTKRYKCCNCEEKFIDKLELAKHQRTHRTVECPMCNKTLRSDKIKQHLASQHPTHDGSSTELFKCAECKKLFKNAAQLTAHRKTIHKKQVCPVCKKATNYGHIRKHLKLFNGHNSSDDSNELSDSSVALSRVPKKDKNSYQCDECGLTFRFAYRLQKHQRVHQKKECAGCR